MYSTGTKGVGFNVWFVFGLFAINMVIEINTVPVFEVTNCDAYGFFVIDVGGGGFAYRVGTYERTIIFGIWNSVGYAATLYAIGLYGYGTVTWVIACGLGGVAIGHFSVSIFGPIYEVKSAVWLGPFFYC